MFGFFDDAAFGLATKPDGGSRQVVGKCSALIDANPETIGILDNHGAVSKSGFGDGSYNVFTHEDAEGEVVAATLRFSIGGEESDDDDEDDEEDKDHEDDEEVRKGNRTTTRRSIDAAADELDKDSKGNGR
jgi:hypothetical protein